MRKVKRKKLHGIWFSIFAFVCKYNIFLDHLIDWCSTIDIASLRAAAETTEEIANNIIIMDLRAGIVTNPFMASAST